MVGNPWIKIFGTVTIPNVVFHSYESDENMNDKFLYDLLNARVCGLEREDGMVDVWKKGEQLKRPLRNKQIFKEKYFAEAI